MQNALADGGVRCSLSVVRNHGFDQRQKSTVVAADTLAAHSMEREQKEAWRKFGGTSVSFDGNGGMGEFSALEAGAFCMIEAGASLELQSMWRAHIAEAVDASLLLPTFCSSTVISCCMQ